jgi:hypothetical protein
MMFMYFEPFTAEKVIATSHIMLFGCQMGGDKNDYKPPSSSPLLIITSASQACTQLSQNKPSPVFSKFQLQWLTAAVSVGMGRSGKNREKVGNQVMM